MSDELLTSLEKEALEVSGRLAKMMREIIYEPCQSARATLAFGDLHASAQADWAEVAKDIHALQNRIMAQAAARAYPGEYRLMGSRIG